MQAIAELLYETSLVTSGFTVDSPKAFADRIYSMIGLAASAPESGNDGGNGGESSGNQAVEADAIDAGNGSNSDPWRQ